MITILLKTGKTVFTTTELQNIFSDKKEKTLSRALYRYKQAGKLLNPRKGIRTLPVFDGEELACALYSNSYISLETVLYEAGAIFQRYGNSTRLVRNNTRSFTFGDHKYITRKIKDDLLYNDIGVRTHNNKRIATPERALCDMVYLRPDPQLDNPEYFHSRQSKNRLKHLLPLYPRTVQDYVEKLLITKV